MDIIALPAFTDNLIWLIKTQVGCVVVDPGDAKPVLDYFDQCDESPSAILLTHHHADHIGGVSALLDCYDIPSYGPPALALNGVKGGDTLTLVEVTFTVLSVPYHTMDHVAYYTPGHLFIADALFSIGCGRLFEGTKADLFAAMETIRALPDETLVYPAHEYTLSNIAFAEHIWPENTALKAYREVCEGKRQKGEWTLPCSLKQEKALNPFLNAEFFAQKWGLAPTEALGKLRSLKDAF